MKNKRIGISVLVGIVIYFIGEFLLCTDIGLAYVAAVLGGGLYWIGSKE